MEIHQVMMAVLEGVCHRPFLSSRAKFSTLSLVVKVENEHPVSAAGVIMGVVPLSRMGEEEEAPVIFARPSVT